MRYFEKLSGERIYLSPINMEDLQQYTKWINDKAVSGFLGLHHQVNGLQQEQKVLAQMVGEPYHFAIVLRDGDALLGNASLMDVQHINRRATLGIFIGEEAYRGKGYGTEAIRLLLDFGFQTLNLHNINLYVHADNARGIACYYKIGFREAGRIREAVYKDGRYQDLVQMDILAQEFRDIADNM